MDNQEPVPPELEYLHGGIKTIEGLIYSWEREVGVPAFHLSRAAKFETVKSMRDRIYGTCARQLKEFWNSRSTVEVEALQLENKRLRQLVFLYDLRGQRSVEGLEIDFECIFPKGDGPMQENCYIRDQEGNVVVPDLGPEYQDALTAFMAIPAVASQLDKGEQ